MKRVFVAIVLLGALGGAGYAIWERVTRLDRLTATLLAHPPGYVWHDDWIFLAAHAGDPRVAKAAALEVEKLSNSCGPNFKLADFDILGPILAAHPIEGPDAARILVLLLSRCDETRAFNWTRVEPKELTRALLPRLSSKLVFETLEKSKAPVDVALIAAVCAQVGILPVASEHLKRGFPPDGAPFVAATEDVTRVAPESDPRLSLAFQSVVAGWTVSGAPTREGLPLALAALAAHPLPKPISDAAVDGALHLATWTYTDQIALAAAAIRGATAAQL